MKVFNFENEKHAEKILMDLIDVSKRFNQKEYEFSVMELHTLTSCYELLKSMLKE